MTTTQDGGKVVNLTQLTVKLLHYETGNWRKLRNEESRNLYVTSNIVMV